MTCERRRIIVRSVGWLCRKSFVLRSRSSPHHQPRLLLRRADAGDDAGIELKEIGFDAVAENYPAFGHHRFDHQLTILLEHSRDEIGAGLLADERLTDDKDQALFFPAPFDRRGRRWLGA